MRVDLSRDVGFSPTARPWPEEIAAILRGRSVSPFEHRLLAALAEDVFRPVEGETTDQACNRSYARTSDGYTAPVASAPEPSEFSTGIEAFTVKALAYREGTQHQRLLERMQVLNDSVADHV